MSNRGTRLGGSTLSHLPVVAIIAASSNMIGTKLNTKSEMRVEAATHLNPHGARYSCSSVPVCASFVRFHARFEKA